MIQQQCSICRCGLLLALVGVMNFQPWLLKASRKAVSSSSWPRPEPDCQPQIQPVTESLGISRHKGTPQLEMGGLGPPERFWGTRLRVLSPKFAWRINLWLLSVVMLAQGLVFASSSLYFSKRAAYPRFACLFPPCSTVIMWRYSEIKTAPPPLGLVALPPRAALFMSDNIAWSARSSNGAVQCFGMVGRQ